jgi:hypothetical protein
MSTTYLIVGVDLKTLSPWHRNVRASNVRRAKRVAAASARSLGVDLVVAGVVGPGGNILPDGGRDSTTTPTIEAA